jgi:hypothetical protein
MEYYQWFKSNLLNLNNSAESSKIEYKRIFIVYTFIDDTELPNYLGAPGYSYWLVIN